MSVKATRSTVLSMRLPVESGRRLKRMANRHGWTPSDASARLVEEGLRRSEFAFIDFRDSSAGRQAYIQGSTLAVWEIMLLVRSCKGNVRAVAKHLRWPEAKVRAAAKLCGGVSGRDPGSHAGKRFSGFRDAETHAAPGDRIRFRQGNEKLRCSSFFWMNISPQKWQMVSDAATVRW